MSIEHLCLSDLLDRDLSSYEYFYSLPLDLQQSIGDDVRSFPELQDRVHELRLKEARERIY